MPSIPYAVGVADRWEPRSGQFTTPTLSPAFFRPCENTRLSSPSELSAPSEFGPPFAVFSLLWVLPLHRAVLCRFGAKTPRCAAEILHRSRLGRMFTLPRPYRALFSLFSLPFFQVGRSRIPISERLLTRRLFPLGT